MARALELVNSYSINEVPSSLQNRFEYSGTNVTYAGHAPRGAASTDNVWTIFQYTYDGNNNVTLKQTAYGAWSDRASLEYT